MHLHINVHCKAPTRGCLRDALDEKRNVLNQDLNATREAIARVRQVTG